VNTPWASADRSLRVVIAGGEAAGQRVLKGLATGGHEVVATFAGSGSTGAPVRAEAGRLGVPVLPAVRVKDPSVVAELGPIDLLVNVHSLFVIAPELLDWPVLGAYNVHPGWLPDFAGRNCPSWAVWLGEPEPGVTVHRMVADVDRGDVAFQDRFLAGPGATGGSVAVECARRGIVLVNRLVDALVADQLDLSQQDPLAFTYFGREVPDDGRFRPERTAVELDRLVRACDYGPFTSPWGPLLADAGGAKVGIRRARLTGISVDAPAGTIRHDADRVLVACVDEWLEVTSVTLDGKPADPSATLPNAAVIG
jgi:methionyl-tRNA formyltransferase